MYWLALDRLQRMSGYLNASMDDSTAKRSFSPRRRGEHGELSEIGTYERNFRALCILCELGASVVEHLFSVDSFYGF